MNFLDSFPIQKRLMTADEVLSALQQRLDHVRRLYKKPSVQLTRNHLIREWVHLPQGSGWLDFLSESSSEFWDDVADSLIEQFAIDLPDNVLASFLKRPRGTLGDLCDVIAQHAEREIIPTVSLTGNPCQSAGLFLALRERLKRFSSQQLVIYPSSSLPDRHREMFLLCDALTVLAPNSSVKPEHFEYSPHVTRRVQWVTRIVLTSFVIAIIAVFLAMITQQSALGWIFAAAFLVMIACAIGLVIYSSRHDRWHWPGLTTYRDLVRAASSQKEYDKIPPHLAHARV
ncbi:MAG: hypothetical protein QM703_11690 [Gemmatales bacterium]